MWRKSASTLRQMDVVLPRWRALIIAPLVALLGLVVLLGSFTSTYAEICSSTEVVTNTDNTGPGSLRIAIANVCDKGVVSFDPALDGSTITLTTQIAINKNVTIDGPGAELIAISGNDATRIFQVASGYHVTIDGLTLKNGAITSGNGAGISNAGVLTVTNSIVTANAMDTANEKGAGIYNSGTLVVSNTVINANLANDGYGGGIGNGGTAKIIASEISSNNGSQGGGGIINTSHMTLIDTVVMKNNVTSGDGIGIHNSGTLTLTGSTVSDHHKDLFGVAGAGIYNIEGKVTLFESVIRDNSLLDDEGEGAGLYSTYGVLNIENSLIADNYASVYGGALYNQNGTLSVVNSTFYSNGVSSGVGGALYFTEAGTAKATVQNVSFVGNYGDPYGGFSILVGAGNLVTVTNSLFVTTTHATSILGGGDQCFGSLTYNVGNVSTDESCGGNEQPILFLPLGELGNYGSNVPIFPLLPGNAAMDQITVGPCPATDGRGIARPQGSSCDAGAFESRGFSLTLEGGNNQATAVDSEFGEALAVGVSSLYSEPVNGGFLGFLQLAGLFSPTLPSIVPPFQIVHISNDRAVITPTANSHTGSYTVAAVYHSEWPFVVFNLENTLPATQVSLESNPNPSTYGESIVFTATVSEFGVTGVGIYGSGTPFAGDVVFWVNGEEYETVPVNNNDTATMSEYNWAAGEYTVTAVFSGNVSYMGSTSNVITQVINKDSSSAEVTSSPNSSEVEENVTFTATVSPGLVIGALGDDIEVQTPQLILTGTVEFYDGATLLGSGTLNKDRVATYTTDDLLAGARSITAVYVGNQNYISSTSSVYTQTVTKHESSTALVAAPTTVIVGELYKITTTLSSPYQATGVDVQTISDPLESTLVYYRNGVYFNETPAGLLTANVLWIYAYEAAGTYTYSAQYLGNDNYAVSNSNVVTVVVNKAESSVALVSSLNPSVYGDNVTFTATVASSVLIDAVSAQGQSFNPLSGDVVFKNGLQTLGTVAMDENGVAVFTTSRFALDAGSHTITAEFVGNEYLNGSASSNVTQVVNKAATTTLLASSNNPATVGESVTFTASVSSDVLLASLDFDIAKSNPLSGDVVFKDGATVLGSGTLNGDGIATLTTNALAVGNHAITAEYGGNGNFNGSASSSLGQVVNEEPEEPIAPVAVNDAAGTLEGQAVSVAVLGNDSAGSNNSLSIQSVTQPDHGSAVIDGNNVVYTPAAGFSGLDSFTYVVVDGNVLTDSGTVAVVVSPQATSGQAPQVKIIDNTVDSDEQFSGDKANIELNVPSGVYSGTLTEKDVFYLALTWIITPTAGNSGNLQFANLSFDLSAYLNGNKLEDFVFGEPVTMTINYGEAVLGGLSPESVQLLFLDGENWSNSGIELVSHNAAERSFVVRISHLSEFALFGSSPTNLDEVDQPGNVQIFMPKLGR